MTTSEVVEQDSPPAPSRLMEIAFAAIALALCAVYLVLGTQIELRREAVAGQIDARFWPLMLGSLGVAAAVALLVYAITRPPATREDLERIRPGGMMRVAVTCVLTIGFVALWSVSAVVAFGYRIEVFPIITAVYMLVLLLLYGLRSWIALIVYPLAVTAFIYVLFGILLRIPL